MPLHFEGISPGPRSLCFIANSYGWINRSPWLTCSLWHLIMMRTTVSLCLWCCVCVSSMPASRGSCPIATPASSCLRLRDRTHMMVRWDQTQYCIHTHRHTISQSLSLFPLFQKRRRAGTMRVTLSPGRYWSTSLSSSSTPRLRGRPGPRRKRASSDPRSVRLARGHKSHRNIIARMGMSALVIIFLWREQPWVCV